MGDKDQRKQNPEEQNYGRPEEPGKAGTESQKPGRRGDESGQDNPRPVGPGEQTRR